MTLAYSYIRFSSEKQSQGDSLRRQLDRSKEWAEKHQLTLDESLNMKDLGVSAFKGSNAEQGALGKFIQAVDAGIVKKGSYLLVESLDRISRTEVSDALQLFLSIINKGIIIVTLVDEKIYSKESLRSNYTELIISIVIMARAHEESAMKSDRVGAAWKRKRLDAAATGKVYTKVTPFWLQVKTDRTGYVVVEKYASIVRRMFQMSRDGYGIDAIEKALNKDKQYTKSGKPWLRYNIAKVLHNEAVIGKAHYAEGNDEYFPSIIDKELFYEVQQGMAQRNRRGTGQKGITRNLFVGLLRCPYCGSTLNVNSNVFSNKEEKRVSAVVVCRGTRYGKKCKAKKMDYFEVQEWILKYLSELDVTTLLSSSNEQKVMLNAVVEQKRGELESLEKRLERLMLALETSDDEPAPVMKRIKAIENEIALVDAELKQAIHDFDQKAMQGQALELHQASIKTLLSKLGDPPSSPGTLRELSKDDETLRNRITAAIKSLVKTIYIHSAGMADGVKYDADTFPMVMGLDKAEYYAILDFGNAAGRLLLPNGVGANWRVVDR